MSRHSQPSRAVHLTLGQRMAVAREAAASPAMRDALCRKHGISDDTLQRWQREFASAGLREVTLDDFRPASGVAGLGREESELLDHIRKLEITLRARSAEASALRGALAGRRLIQHLNRE
jgi:hypothetical protein